MKKIKKLFIIIILFILILANGEVFASDILDYVGEVNYTERFKKWLELSEEAKSQRIEPIPFEISKEIYYPNNPLTSLVGNSSLSKYSLREDIPENIIIRNQEETGSCWCFGALGALESNLALNNFFNHKNSIIYDFSERHMEYSTTRVFKNNEINEMGYNRKVGQGGNYLNAVSYLTNGQGAILEKNMPFENNEDIIDIGEIKNKEVVTQIYDTRNFPSYEITEDTTEIKNMIKDHVKKYGGVQAGIYGAQLLSEYCNNNTGAIYADDAEKAPINHEVLIIGWDDNYSRENFNEEHRPRNNGAWIIKNSWGEYVEYPLSELQVAVFEVYKDMFASYGIISPEQIPYDFMVRLCEEMGLILDGDVAKLSIGDKGIMYLSYEDVNVYSQLHGIEKATDTKNYDNIYQYDELSPFYAMPLNATTLYVGTKYEKKNAGTEYLTDVAIYAPETYNCRVYVNPNNDSISMKDMVPVKLKAGDSETFNAGYHTLEFLEPVELKSDKFSVIVKVQGLRDGQISVSTETSVPGTVYETVKTVEGKCFWTVNEFINVDDWVDFGKMSEVENIGIDFDSSVKAFTVNSIEKHNVSSIEIASPPTKTKYIEGEDFNKSGMVVEAIYENSERETITDYKVKDGNNLKLNQKEVTIEYEGKTAKQSIIVEESNNQTILKAENTDFSNARAKIINIETSKNENKLDIEIFGIRRSTSNDSFEYYYFVSSNPNEKNIKDWVKIDKNQTESNTLEFSINTKDIENYAEISRADRVYVYIKEIAKKGTDEKEVISKALSLNMNSNNNDKNDDKGNNNNKGNDGANLSNKDDSGSKTPNKNKYNSDNTVSNKKLPATGWKLTIFGIMFAVSIIGLIMYKKYRKMKF